MIIKPFHFMRLFLKVQENILAIITNKSLIGMATYKDKLILKRVQEQLDFMVNKSWQYAPDLFTNIYLNAKIDKHIRALGMNATDQVAVSRIVDNFMGHILETSSFSYKTLKKTMEETRAELLNQSGALSTMERAYKDLYVENIRKQGLVGFIDKANKRWSFGNYTKMLLDTSTRITNNYAVIYTYEKHDLYKIIGHANSCKKCAAHKNRVYSRSGTNKFYPSLASAFGKIDKSGLDTLENSYLSIHPNCLVDTGEALFTERSTSLMRRKYIGKVAVITTSSGNKNTVTINHPILTPFGFIPAGRLKKGQKIGKALPMYASLRRHSPDNINGITSLSKEFESLLASDIGGTRTVSMPVTAVDFHNDGILDTEVDIIFTNSFAERERDVCFIQKSDKVILPPAWLRGILFNPNRPLGKIMFWFFTSSYFIMKPINLIISRHLKSIRKRQAVKFTKTHAKFIGDFIHSSISRIKSFKFIKKFGIILNPFFRYCVMLKNPTANRLMFYIRHNAISFDNIKSIEIQDYNGYVYNPETYYGFYNYGGIISSNCKCSIIPFTEGGKTAREIEEIREFSNYETNPLDRDPRTERQIEVYNNKVQGRQKLVNTFKEFQDMKLALGERMPKTFNTFLKHKLANSEQFRAWKQAIHK